MKNIKLFTFFAVLLFSAFVSTAWAADVTVTYTFSYTSGTLGANRHGHITRQDKASLTTEWNHGPYGVLWPADETHGVDDEYDITFKPNYELNSKEVNNVKAFATEKVANSSTEGTTFTVEVEASGYYIKSVTFKNGNTNVATASNTTVANSKTLNVVVTPEKFFTKVEVVLTDDYYGRVTLGSELSITTSPSLTYSNTDYYLAGSTVTIAPTNANCIVDNVKGVNGANIADNKRSFSFTMPVGDASPTATISEVHTVNVPSNLTISKEYISIGTTKYYKTGEPYTLTIASADDIIDEITGVEATFANGKKNATFTMPSDDVTISAKTFKIWGDGDGSKEKPYTISRALELDSLSERVNAGNSYEGKYFKLIKDIKFEYEGKWEGALTNTENLAGNFTAIGTDQNKPFKGNFNGDRKTIRGIRINKSGDQYQGLFGYLGEGAVVDSVRLADVVILGGSYTGGIAGYSYSGEIRYCTVDSVLIKGKGRKWYGGVVGYNEGTVSGCTSSATLTSTSGSYFGGVVGSNEGTVSGCTSSATLTSTSGSYIGGIVGYHGRSGKVSGNLAIGVTIPAVDYHGAIVGYYFRGSLSNNFYTACTVGSDKDVINVGVGNNGNVVAPHDVTDKNGAVSMHTVTLGEGVSIKSPNEPIYTDNDKNVYYKVGETITLTVANENEIIDEITGVEATIANGKKNATFTMPSKNVTITTFKIWGDGDGSKGNPYTISRALELDSLSERVNAGNSYEGKYFKLINDIKFDYEGKWEGALTNTENLAGDFIAIGTQNKPFKGNFNGDGKTIRGIRINKPGDEYQGLFGYLGKGAVVDSVKLADVVILGGSNTGGIAGSNSGEIRYCTVDSVLIKGDRSNYGGVVGYNGGRGTVSNNTSSATLTGDGKYYGGVVGGSYGEVSNNTSSATLTSTSGSRFGGVVGDNFRGTVSGNLAIGVTIPAVKYHGAIVGYINNGSLSNNFYTACTVGSDKNVSNVGVGNNGNVVASHDVAESNGAVSMHTVTLGEGISIASPNEPIYTDNDKNVYYNVGETITLTVVNENEIIDEITGVEATFANGKKNATFTMPSEDVTISAKTFKIWGDGDGSKEKPYTISRALELDSLSERVNAGNSYEGKYFKLINDIKFDYEGKWEGVLTNTENLADNFTAIGTDVNPFKGNFNGDRKTIRGIRINEPGKDYQGLFGYLGKGAVVDSVKLADVVILGGSYTGGIAGYNNFGEIRYCTVDSVLIKGDRSNYGGVVGGNSGRGTVSNNTSSATLTGDGKYYGGVVGGSYGEVSNNTSSATLESTSGSRFGGVVGYNGGRGTVSNNTSSATLKSTSGYFIGGVVGYNAKGTVSGNLAIGVTIPAVDYHGAIVGYNDDGPLSNNFYTACTVGDEKNVTNVGVGNVSGDEFAPHDVTDKNGAVGMHTVTLGEGVSISENPVYTDKDQNEYYAAGSTITFSFTSPDGKDFSYTIDGTRIPDKITMPAKSIKVSVDYSDYWGIASGADGSKNKPYIISTVDDLNTLASFVNSGYDTEGKYFKVAKDIEFDHDIDWENASTSTENNFTAIGNEYNQFKGNFNGDGKTIRGIRINEPGKDYQGLFGYLGKGAVVDSVKLADVVILGGPRTGGIAGSNYSGIIRYCTVDSVLIKGDGWNYGGVVGYNEGTVSNNTSSATLMGDGSGYGGVVGGNRGEVSGNTSSATLTGGGYIGGVMGSSHAGSVKDNLVIRATIPAVKYHGAIVGYIYESSLSNNFYTACTVGDEKNVTNVGVGNVSDDEFAPHDVTENNGAVGIGFTAPVAVKNLVYNKSSQDLVTEGYSDFGTLLYSLDGKNYSTAIPSAVDAEKYTVYYRVDKDNDNVIVARTIEVSIAPKIVLASGAVQILEDQKGKRAEIDGAYKTDKKVVEITDVKVDSVVFKRTFTKGAFSTIMLPFSINVNKVSGADFYQIKDIKVEINDNGGKKDTIWGPVTISVVEDEIKANSPYLLGPTETSLSFDIGEEGVVLNTSEMNPYTFTKEGVQWEFCGTYHYFDFGNDSTQLIKKSYGFAAKKQDNGLGVGDFSWTSDQSFILPMRCYLVYNRLEDNGDSEGEGQGDGNGNGEGQGDGGAKPQMVKAKAPSRSIYSSIPETLEVQIVDEKGGKTVIGTLNTRSGELRLKPRPKHTYDLKGRRVNATRKAKGVYVER